MSGFIAHRSYSILFFYCLFGLFISIFLIHPIYFLYAQESEQQKNGSQPAVIDKFPSTGIGWLDISILLVTGGVVTTWLTLLFDYLHNKRSLLLDISKHKIETLSNMIPTYARLATSSIHLSRELKKSSNEFDYTICLYLFSHIFYALQEMQQKAGGIQLTNNAGEKVVSSLLYDINSFFLSDTTMGFESVHFMRGLIKNDTNFYQFKYEIIADKKQFLSKFSDFINNMGNTKRKDLQNKCDWLYRVIIFETNQVYRHWYARESISISIDDDFMTYLRSSEKTKPFIDRLNHTNIPLRQKLVRLLQLEHPHPYAKER
jgi:hypothetical protein